MSISEKDLKLLWSRSGGMCAFPGCRQRLTVDISTGYKSHVIGEQAHIVARSEYGPRGSSRFTPEERDSYANLILLCPTHHSLIDMNVDDFPPERLYKMKIDHESWILETLSLSEIAENTSDIIYANIVDSFTRCLMIESWTNWTSELLFVSPSLPLETVELYRDLNEKFDKALWPQKHEALEIALKNGLERYANMLEVVLKHMSDDGNRLIEDRFYTKSRNSETYLALKDEYCHWLLESESKTIELAKAVNWVAEEVRRFLNPRYFVSEGKFSLRMYSDALSTDYKYTIPEYNKEEKEEMIESSRKDTLEN